MNINDLIKQLQDLQDKGHTEVKIESDSWVSDFGVLECNVYSDYIIDTNPKYPEQNRNDFTNLTESQIDYLFQSIETQKVIDKKNIEKSKFIVVLSNVL